MIPSRQEIAYRLYGAWRLARLDAGGAQFFDESRDAALRSFFAAALVAPAFAIINALYFGQSGLTTNEPAPVVLLVFALYYCLLWVVPPVIVYQICLTIGRESAFFRFLSANNWSSVIVILVEVLAVLLNAGGIVPEVLAPLLTLVVYAYVLTYQWFLTRHCLDVTPLAAVGFVVLHFIIGYLITSIATGMIFQPVTPVPA